MNLFIHLLCLTCFLDQVINTVAGKKETSNIILSGGSGNGCKGEGGGGALVMESGKKGKKNEKLIMKDDTLIMQNGEADGNIIMDGNNLIFKEGKKEENIIIKGNSGGHCCQHGTHKEEHIHIPPPLPIHFKKKIEHHHHTKEVHHHNDDLGLGGYRRKDAKNDSAEKKETEDEYIAEQSESVPKRTKFKKKKIKIRKLKLGDKLSLKEKEHLKLKRVDKRFGLPRFKLAGKMIQKIRWRKNAQKTNSSSHENKSKKAEEVHEKAEQTKDDEQQENTATNTDQQYEDEDTEDSARDQEDETSNSYEGITGSMYPILNPTATGYMTTGFNNMMMDLYPPEPLTLQAAASKTLTSDRRDLKKKYEKINKVKKFEKSDNINEDIREDNDQKKTEDEKSDLDQSEEITNDQEENLKLNKIRSAESRGIKSIDHNKKEITTTDLQLKNKNLIQPLFALDERQLTPALFSLLSLATNAAPHHQSLVLRNQHLNHRYPFTNNPTLVPTATLPLFTPAKPSANLDRSAALLLELIGHQSNQQQKLIIAQHQKLLEQEAKQKELTKQLQQAQKKSFSKSEYKDKFDYFNRSQIYDETLKNEEKSKLLYENELNHWDRQENDDDNKYKKAPINRLNKRKLNLNRQDQSKRVLIKRDEEQFVKSKVSNDDEFDFADFDEEEDKLEPSEKLNRQQQQPFSKRTMYIEPKITEFEESKLVTNRTSISTDDQNSTNHNDYKASTINEKKQASLIVYGY